MTVVINEQHSVPMAAAVAYFRATSPTDSVDVTETANLARRVLLNRAASSSDNNQSALAISSANVSDATTYVSVFPSERAKSALTAQANLFLSGPIKPEEVRAQSGLSLAIEYRTRGNPRAFADFDDPAEFSRLRLAEIARAEDRPEAPPPPSELLAETSDQVARFYRSTYRPEKLVVSVAGDVMTFDTLVAVQQLYGGFVAEAETRSPAPLVERGRKEDARRPPAQPASASKTPPETANVEPAQPDQAPVLGLRYAADRADINQTVISVGFVTAGPGSADWSAIQVLAAVLGQGRASRLARALVTEQPIASNVSAELRPIRGSNLLTLQLRTAPENQERANIDKAESTLFKEVERIRHEILSEGELIRAKSILEKRLQDETSDYLGRALALAHTDPNQAALGSSLDNIARIRSVKAEEVQRVAAKYLTLTNTSVHEYEPLSSPPRTFDSERFSATVKQWATTFADAVDPKTVRQVEGPSAMQVVAQGQERPASQQLSMESIQPLPIKDFSTLNGPRAFVREDHSRPEVTALILFQGGRLVEDSSNSGITELMLRSIIYGTPRRLYPQLSAELDQLGADVQIVTEPDFFGFRVSVIARNAERAIRLVRDVIEEPAFRDDDVERARREQLGAIREDRDLAVNRARELLLQAMVGGHAYSLPAHGRQETVAALKGDQLREWHANTVKKQLPIAIIIGDTNGSALISGTIAEGFRRRELGSSFQVKMPAVAKGAEKVEQRARPRTVIAIGTAGPRAGSPDRAPLDILLAAMNLERLPRIFQSKPPITTRVRLEAESWFAAGLICAVAITQPDEEQKTRAAILAEMDRIASNGLAPQELERARNLAIATKLVELQSRSTLALEYARTAFYQNEAGEVDSFSERLMKVTPDDVKRVASTYFRSPGASAGVLRGSQLRK